MKLLFALLVTLVTYCVIALTPSSVEAQQAKLAPLPLEESLNALRFGFSPISVCPADQRWVVYQLRNVKRPESLVGRYGYSTGTGVPVSQTDGDIWITDIDSGVSKNLTEGKGSSWAAVWSPNGEYLAFYSDRSGQSSLWVWERLTGKLRQVSNVAPRPYIFSPYDLPIWTPDSKSILVKTFPEGTVFPLVSKRKTTEQPEQPSKTPKALDFTIFHSAADPKRAESPVQWATGGLSANDLSEAAADFSLIQIATGRVERIATGYTPAGYWMSPDGERIAFLNVTGKKDSWSLFDLVVVSLSDKRKQIIASGIQQTIFGLSVGWVPDSKRLVYLSMGDWFSIASAGGPPQKLTQTSDPTLAFALPQTDLWDASGESFYFVANNSVRKVSLSTNSTTEVAKLPQKRLLRIVAPRRGASSWSPKNGSLLIATRDEQNKQAGFYRVDLATGGATRLMEQRVDFGDFPTPQLEVAQNRDNILYIVEDAQHCKDIWLAKSDFSAPPRRVTNSNPLFDGYVLGESRLIEWHNADGVKLRGALLLPANYQAGTRYPLIVNVYGGDIMSNRINQFGFSWSPVLNMQLLATRGYAVLLPDTILRQGTPMADIAECVLPGVNKVIEMGIADPEKLGVMGSSYGGYSTLSLIVQTNRFKAAISDAGPASLIGAYSHLLRSGEAGYIGWAESGRGNMGGSLWKYRERFVENSPLFYLDRVQTPILILQGTEDEATPTFLADELFTSLQRLGKETTYVRYQGEGHTITSYTRAAQIDYLTRVFNWFDTWIKGPRPEPEISKQ